MKVKASFEIGRPLSHFVSRNPERGLRAQFEKEVYPRKRVDIDNMQKFVLDVFTGVAYHDDVQVCVSTEQKVNAAGRKGRIRVVVSRA